MEDQHFCVVTGHNIALAITPIKRLKELLMNPESEHQLPFDTIEKCNMLANLKQMVDEELVVLDLEKHAGLILAPYRPSY